MDQKGATWRIVEQPGGTGFWMTIVNIGRNTAELTLSVDGGSLSSAVDMLTGEDLGSEFSLRSNGVLLLDIQLAGS